ncbi:primase alpha helix C-terminal domain-containing protein [Staphylococcus sp. IPLA37010]|uniref:Primase alpha helix C-terminal domain-containing protein n=1 Tax=Staphylococcus equorum TaxID=246432 RepID=A0AAW7ALD3_9STAP|nr:primase alpha helix C-terminal domain-containing protein [Staphylococcus equorum]MDK9866410.1 primase alpha helix C-terminal domain-containing protein [Staphylococcus equorum]
MGTDKIILEHDIKMDIAYVPHFKNTKVSNINVNYSDILSRLNKRPRVDEKGNNGSIIGGKTDGTKIKDSVLNRTMLTLDYDDLEPHFDFFNEVSSQLDCNFCVYTTTSHVPEAPRYRLFIPLDKAYQLTESEYAGVVDHIANKIIKIDGIDKRSNEIVRVMHLPTVLNDESEYIFKYQDEELLNINSILDKVQNTIVVNAPIKKRDSSYWRDLAFGVGEGERNHSLASISGLLLRRYVPPELAYGLVTAWGKSCNPPMDDSEINKTFNSILKKYMNN